VDARHDTTARVRRAERAADGGVVDVPQALHVSPIPLPINAQWVARFDHYFEVFRGWPYHLNTQ
jgi:hypothetical protein